MTRIPSPPGRAEHDTGDALRAAVATAFFLIGAVCAATSITGPATPLPATLLVLAAAPLAGAHVYATAVPVRRWP